jgi:lipoprotein-releasing system ATP-binding protein
MSDRKIILSARGISKTFKKEGAEVNILKQVDIDVREGEMIAITGASGVGKSTLLHILGTLERPSSGTVLFGEQQTNLFKLGDTELAGFRNRSLGFVFQFHYLLPEFSALENVMMPGLIAGQSKSEASDKARELLGFVGLEHRLTHRPSELSGGEQQRVAIARAVILGPKLVLADELTGNLDSQNGGMVMDLLTRLNQRSGISFLLVTHDERLAARMHRRLSMQDGKFVTATPPSAPVPGAAP